MIKLRFVFLIVFVFVILVPIQQYLNLSEQRDLFVEASQIRSQSSEKIIAPRKTIVDRNQNDLAISIQRPTLIFKTDADKEKIINFAIDNSKIIFLNANKRLYFESILIKNLFQKPGNFVPVR